MNITTTTINFEPLLADWRRLRDLHKQVYADLDRRGKADTEDGQVSWAYMNTYGGCIEQLEQLLKEATR